MPTPWRSDKLPFVDGSTLIKTTPFIKTKPKALFRGLSGRVMAQVLGLLQLVGCGLSITSVSPERAVAGEENLITAIGSGFDADVQFQLQAGSVEVALSTREVLSETEVTLSVPAAAPSAIYDLVANNGPTAARLEAAFTLTDEQLTIVFVDVGQGDCTLIISPSGEVLLFDGGGLGQGSAVREAVETYAAGRVDQVVLSHYDADHLAGLVNFLSGPDGEAGSADDLLPQGLYAPTDDGSCDSQTCGRFRNLLAYGGLTVPTPGDEIVLGDLNIEVVAVDGRVGSRAQETSADSNGRGVVLRLRYAERHVLLLGDLTGGGLGTIDLETALSIDTGPVDLLRAAHHGSRTSSASAAIERWAPALTVLSVGTDNAFCHPAQDILERLAASSSALVTTGRGVVNSVDRCDGVTVAPSNAQLGRGTMVFTVVADGTMRLDGEDL